MLAIKLNHVPVDGQGAKQYAYLLADVYNRLADDPAYIPEANQAPRPTARDVWQNLTPAQRRAAKRAKPYAIPNWPVPSRGTSGMGLTYRRLAVAPEMFRALKQYGRDRGATVNDMLLAIYFRALVRAFDPPTRVPLSLMSTADHRRYLPAADNLSIGTLSISGPLGIGRVDGEPFEKTLARVRESMEAWEASCYGVGAALSAEKMSRLGYRMTQRILGLSFKMAPKGKTFPYLTNIGVLDEQRLNFDGVMPVSGYMYGPAAMGASVVATVSTYRETLTITMGLCESDMDPAIVEDVLSLVDEELAAVTR